MQKGQVLPAEVTKKYFNDLDNIKRDIQCLLMPLVQNEGFPIRIDDIFDFEMSAYKIVKDIQNVRFGLKDEYLERAIDSSTELSDSGNIEKALKMFRDESNPKMFIYRGENITKDNMIEKLMAGCPSDYGLEDNDKVCEHSYEREVTCRICWGICETGKGE